MKGTVVKFDRDRGFGFIRRPNRAADIFAHIIDVEGHSALTPGENVTFDLVETERGPRATHVVADRAPRSPIVIFLDVALLLTAVSTVLLGLFVDLGWFWSYLIGIPAVTFIIYGYDKAIAGGTATRVPERVLHILTVIGGTVGALLGQQLFRHKTFKKPFVLWFRGIVILQALIVALIGYFT